MVWQIITAVAGASSAIAAMIACILTYRTTRPSVRVKVNKILFVEGLGKRFAFADITVVNKSSVKGTVAEMTLRKGKVKCEGEYKTQRYDLTGINFEMYSNGIPAEATRLTLPITVDPFAVVNGFIVFPCLPDSITVGDRVSILVNKTDDIPPIRSLIKFFRSFIYIFTKRRNCDVKYIIERSAYYYGNVRADSNQDKAASGNDIDNRAN